jgi:hypothetical protein
MAKPLVMDGTIKGMHSIVSVLKVHHRYVSSPKSQTTYMENLLAKEQRCAQISSETKNPGTTKATSGFPSFVGDTDRTLSMQFS